MNVPSKRIIAPVILSILILFSVCCEPVWAGDERLHEIDPIVLGAQKQPSEQAHGKKQIYKKNIFLQIGAARFDPLDKEASSNDAVKSIESYESGEKGYYIVQFDGPVQKGWKEALSSAGAEIFDYIPDFSFILRLPAENEETVRELPHVRWLGIYQPSFRISQSVMSKVYSLDSPSEDEMITLRINLFSGADIASVEASVAAMGGTVEKRHTTNLKTTLKVTVPESGIQELPAIEGVKWIEQSPQWKMLNDVSTDIVNVRSARNTYGLYGEGQTVGVADTGLDQGDTTPEDLHDDFEDGRGASRVLEIIDRVDADETGVDESDVNGHGTHVAGSVLGNGILSGSDPANNSFPDDAYAGVAPKAKLVFQATENNDTGSITGVPADLNELFEEAETAGANLHTNSWGAETASMYTSYSQDVDEYMWNHPTFLILFAAGNEGADLDGDGVIDLYNIDSPATAKNCLTVGASEGDRPIGAAYDFSWGAGWSAKYSADPIKSDHLSDNDRGLAAFSSRGPTLDGRYKPDLVAPGTNILSVRTQALGSSEDVLWGNFDENYAWSGGTSMATPLAAGASALMREYLIKEEGFANPSAALIKAALLNSAEDIGPGQYFAGTTQEIPDSAVPNNVEGWGRLNLGDGVYPSSPYGILFYDETTGLETGVYMDYAIKVTDAGTPLRINLTWTDYPGLPSVHGGLVNDLDLRLTSPSGDVYYPDQALQKTTIRSLSYDPDSYDGYSSRNVAVRFTPESYPAYLSSTTFYYYNKYSETTDVDVVVYGDDEGLPDTANELFRKTLTYVPTGLLTIPLDLTVSSGDVHIAIERSAQSHFGIVCADNSNPTGRTSSKSTIAGASWITAGYTAIIRANFRYLPDSATSFDRVNNSVGVMIDAPTTGVYTVRVAGYNVPQGPQPFALVASGDIKIPTRGVVQFDTDTYSVRENSGVATITVTRTEGSDGAASVEYSTVDGTATEGNDYVAVSGTLSWTDGDSSGKTISVTITDDTTQGTSKSFKLSLSNATGSTLGATATTALTITDNDGTTSSNESDGGGGGGGGCFISTITD